MNLGKLLCICLLEFLVLYFMLNGKWYVICMVFNKNLIYFFKKKSLEKIYNNI